MSSLARPGLESRLIPMKERSVLNLSPIMAGHLLGHRNSVLISAAVTLGKVVLNGITFGKHDEHALHFSRLQRLDRLGHCSMADFQVQRGLDAADAAAHHQLVDLL